MMGKKRVTIKRGRREDGMTRRGGNETRTTTKGKEARKRDGVSRKGRNDTGRRKKYQEI